MILRALPTRTLSAVSLSTLLLVGGFTIADDFTGSTPNTPAVTQATGPSDPADDHGHAHHCDNILPALQPGQPDACAHADQAPPGVDITKNVPTPALQAREGAAEGAVEAAQAEGVAVANAFAGTSNRVACDGDGTSGYRTQAIYVVTADKTNRYAAVADQIKEWAAGVDTMYRLSAAKTGGVRNVRYVTEPNGDGTCTPTVLNVTLPAGSNASFNSTITAMQNAGYASGARKYLMWVDATGYCGIATTYLSSSPAQSNPNNGAYAQYARIDPACWGLSPSVEGHELSHTMGSVQGDAPHATRNGHCWDESDRMCYADGGGFAMKQICSGDQEALFDCNDDDYYSTFPPTGTYLATHWNTADSRFLIGGGNGNNGGTTGTPTRLGGTLGLNNPAVPGLATQASVNLDLPNGRIPTITWTSSRRDCEFSAPKDAQTSITCDSRITTAAPITVTVTDNTGDKIVRTSSLTFDKTPRAHWVGMNIDGDVGPHTACFSGKAVLSAMAFDQQTSAPIKGVNVTWTRRVETAAPVRVASAVTAANGTATSPALPMSAGEYTATTAQAGPFAPTSTNTIPVTVTAETCVTALTNSVDYPSVQAGQPVRIAGRLTRQRAGGSPENASGERVAIYARATNATNWTLAGSAVTAANGVYVTTLKPVTSATYQARFTARKGFTASVAEPVDIAVTPWETALTLSPGLTTQMADMPLKLTGTLTQTDGQTASGVASARVTINYPLAAGKSATATAITNSAGLYTLTIRPTGTGTIAAQYAGKAGWTPSAATEPLTVNEWVTAATVDAVRNPSTGVVTVSGTLTATDANGTSTPKASTLLQLTYPYNATRTVVVNVVTKANGTYATTVKPGVSGDITARFPGAPGWGSSTANPATVTVP
jgi:hypothetical protein